MFQHPNAMRPAATCHDALLRQAITDHQGLVVKTTGDGFHTVFTEAPLAVAAALSAQRALQAQAWETVPALRVRMALHTAAADLRDGDYYGAGVNRCFLRLAEEGEIGAWGAGQIEWLDRLEAAHDNLRAALAWARDGQDPAEASARAALGEEAFEAAWSRGRDMSMDEAVADALEAPAE